MGRNSTPKIGEWREGELYKLEERNGMMVATRTTARYEKGVRHEDEEVLCCFYNDSFAEAVFSSFQSGFDKGMKAGIAKAQRDFRRAIGIES